MTAQGIALALVAAAVGVAGTAETWSGLFASGFDHPEASQAPLGLVVAVMLFMQRLPLLRRAKADAPWPGLLLVVAGIGLSWAGERYGWMVACHVGATATVAGCFHTAAGIGSLRAMGPIWLIMLLALPLPGVVRQTVTIPLQGMVTQAASDIARQFSWGGTHDGTNFLVGREVFTVADACSGLSLVRAVLIMTVAVAFGEPMSTGRRLLLFVSSVPVALALNLIRILSFLGVFAWLGTHEAMAAHDLVGWILMSGAIAVPLGIGTVLRHLTNEGMPHHWDEGTPSNRPTGGPSRLRMVALAAAAIALVVRAPFLADPGSDRERHARIVQAVEAIPDRLGLWRSSDQSVAALEDVLDADAAVSRYYRLDGVEDVGLTLIVAYCDDARAMEGHTPEVCYPSQGWTLTRSPGAFDAARSGRPGRVLHFSKPVPGGTQSIRVHHFVWMPGTIAHDHADEIRHRAVDRTRRFLGVCQVQIILPAELAPELADPVVDRFLDHLSSVHDLCTSLERKECSS